MRKQKYYLAIDNYEYTVIIDSLNNIRNKASEIINAEVIFPDWKHKPLAEMQAAWLHITVLDKIRISE